MQCRAVQCSDERGREGSGQAQETAPPHNMTMTHLFLVHMLVDINRREYYMKVNNSSR